MDIGLGVFSPDDSVSTELVEISIGAMATEISGVRLASATDLSNDPVNHWCVRACLNVIDCCILSLMTGSSGVCLGVDIVSSILLEMFIHSVS